MVNVVSATATEVSGATVSVELPHEVAINVSAAIVATVNVVFLIVVSPYLMLLMRI
jgi:hypothetical protein